MRFNLVVPLLLAALAQSPCLYGSEYGQNDDDDDGNKQASNSQAAPASDSGDSSSPDGGQTAGSSGGDGGFGDPAGAPGGGSDLSSGRGAFGGASAGGGGVSGASEDVCYRLCGPGTPGYHPERLANCAHQVVKGLPPDCNSWFQATNVDVSNIRQGVKAKEAAGQSEKAPEGVPSPAGK